MDFANIFLTSGFGDAVSDIAHAYIFQFIAVVCIIPLIGLGIPVHRKG